MEEVLGVRFLVVASLDGTYPQKRLALKSLDRDACSQLVEASALEVFLDLIGRRTGIVHVPIVHNANEYRDLMRSQTLHPADWRH